MEAWTGVSHPDRDSESGSESDADDADADADADASPGPEFKPKSNVELALRRNKDENKGKPDYDEIATKFGFKSRSALQSITMSFPPPAEISESDVDPKTLVGQSGFKQSRA